MAREDTGRYGFLVGRSVLRIAHIHPRVKRHTFSSLGDVNSPQGRGFITSPMGPLGKVSSGGQNRLFIRGLGRPTWPSFPEGAVAAGGVILITPPAGVTAVSMVVGGEDTSGLDFV